MAGMLHFRSWAHAPAALLATLLLASTLAPARAESLMERRNAMNKGTNQGVVIIDAAPDNSTAAAGAQDTATGEKPTGLRAMFNKLQPPSGCPMELARNGGCPDQGIAVPTGEPSPSNTPNFSR
jgi:hypothetical protein